MDLDKLTPAPWHADVAGGEPIIVALGQPPGQNGIASVWVHGQFSGNVEWNKANHEFIALARNAFDVMMRRGWGIVNRWEVGNESVPHARGFRSFCALEEAGWFADPFTALVASDAWYIEHVEKGQTP